MRKFFLLVASFAALGAGACSSGIQDAAVRSVAESRLSNQQEITHGDGMKVLICGSSSPLPAAEAAGPCVAIIANGRVWIVDAGDGSAENLQLWGMPGQSVAAILLTHFHSDHIAEIPDMNQAGWVGGRAQPLAVRGPQGVDKVVDGFTMAYSQSQKYRVAHHGADLLPADIGRLEARPFAIGVGDPTGTTVKVLEEDGLVITATKVEHAPVDPAVAYRFDFKGRSVVVSGDTIASKAVEKLASGVDVLVHEALAAHIIDLTSETARKVGADRQARFAADIPDYHATPVEVAEIANRAGASLLIYYHLVPYPENFLIESVFLRGVSDVRDEDVIVGYDGLLVNLPPHSKEVEIGELG